MPTWLQSVSFLVLLLHGSFPSPVDIFLNANDIIYIFFFLAYKSLLSTPKLLQRERDISCFKTEHTDYLYGAESLSLSAAECRHTDCTLSLEVNHVISGLFSIIWHWQPFQNIGDLGLGGGVGRRVVRIHADGQTATEHKQRYIPVLWSLQQMCQEIV